MQTNIDDLKPAEGMLAGLHLSIASSRAIDVVTLPHVSSTVFVLDGDPSVRASLEPLVRAQGWKAETFSTAADFLSRPRIMTPCCLLLDIAPPGLTGLELQRRLATRTDMPIVFITDQGDVPTTVRAMKAGAFDFLTKPLEHDVLVAVLRHALERSRAVLHHESALQALRTRYVSLTPRERDVMALVISGLLNKQVAGELGISEITVKAHRGQVMRKMKADSLAGLVTMGARLGLRSVAPTH
jgi:FixJ family two-component response regulator